MSKVLIIGCASYDTIHLEPSGLTVETLGGAGLYTALAVRAAGAECTLLSPRTIPTVKKFADLYAHFDWVGPTVEENEMPHLAIVQHGNDKATLKSASWAAESQLTPDALPSDLNQYALIHIGALSSAAKQLEFASFIKQRSECRLSAGTYAKLAYNETDVVKEVMDGCDFFFMNENEATAIFGGTRDAAVPKLPQVRFITRGHRGATLLTHSGSMEVSAFQVAEVDPTGAGDVFCGTVLGALANGSSLSRCTTLAVERAAVNITKPGPQALFDLLRPSKSLE